MNLELLEGTGAIKVAEQISKQINDLQIHHGASPVDNIISLSLGVSSIIPLSSSSPHNLIANADDALYDAKFKGRNQIVYKSME